MYMPRELFHREMNGILFSSPEPKARVSYCHSAPSVRPSSVRPSGVNFHIFDFFSETAERNSTKLDRKQDLNGLYQVCVFRADRKNKMAALASDWLRYFQLLLWNRWTEFNETWQEARSQRLLPSLCFSGRSEKQNGRPGLWLAETFSTSPLKGLNGIQRNLTGSKISTPSTKFVFFGPIGKTRWPPWRLIGWDIFDFSSETAERNSRKLDRKQNLNSVYQVCVFRADRKNKMAALASDWLRHFRLLLWNRWTEFKETCQEARSQRPLPSLCFSGRSEKQDGRHGLWLVETFSTSLKLLNGIQQNLTGSKISTFSTKFVFFEPIIKQKCPPWPIPQKGGTLYSGARYVALWASCLCIYLGERRGVHMYWGVLARSTQGRIQGWAKIGHRGPLLQENSSSDRKAAATNRMYNNHLEACGKKCFYFFSIPKSNFLCFHCSQVSDSGPLGLLFYGL